MGKKKRNQPDLDEILQRPWCYYCERDFDDLKILINHQRAKHFKCDRCGKRLNTAGGLSVHMSHVHKESLTTIENALPNRAGVEIEIYGTEGIPEEIVIAHRQRVATQFVQAGNQPMQHNINPAAGGSGQNPSKKQKLEGVSDLKKRLAEHKARKAAEEEAAANGGSPAVETPPAQPQTYGPPPGFTPPQFAAPFTAPSGQPGPMPAPVVGFNGYPSPYNPPIAQYQGPPPTFGSPPVPFGQQPFQPPPFQPPVNVYAPPAQYQIDSMNGTPRAFGTNSPNAPFQGPSPVPTSGMSLPPRLNSLPSAPGLPQRPAFGVPAVNAFQLQQMHQGHIPDQMPSHQAQQKASTPNVMASSLNGTEQTTSNPSQPSVPQTTEAVPPLEAKVTDPAAEKKNKKEKEKEKETKLVYSDNDISPEEKLSKLASGSHVAGKGKAGGTLNHLTDTVVEIKNDSRKLSDRR